MASSHKKGNKPYKGKGKSVNATGRKTETKSICATQRIDTLSEYLDAEEELEIVNDRIEELNLELRQRMSDLNDEELEAAQILT